jgi:hypothetical protein
MKENREPGDSGASRLRYKNYVFGHPRSVLRRYLVSTSDQVDT